MNAQVGLGVRLVRDLSLVILCIALRCLVVEARAQAYRCAAPIDDLNGVSFVMRALPSIRALTSRCVRLRKPWSCRSCKGRSCLRRASRPSLR
jgi:hypothetical protein